jgi:hypothetical protein
MSVHEQRQLDEVIERLTARYPAMSRSTVSEVVHDLHTTFAGAPLREYVALFVERRARAALEELSVPYDSLPSVPSSRHAVVASTAADW